MHKIAIVSGVGHDHEARLAAAFALSGTIAFAADLPSRKGMPAAPASLSSCTESDGEYIPIDAFGFTAGSDVAEKGACGAEPQLFRRPRRAQRPLSLSTLSSKHRDKHLAQVEPL